jgi:hypothetical protein
MSAPRKRLDGRRNQIWLQGVQNLLAFDLLEDELLAFPHLDL